MTQDASRGHDAGIVAADLAPNRDRASWHCAWTIEKWHRAEDHDAGGAPDETIDGAGNILLTTGITALLTLLQGGGGTPFNTANAYIGVGDSATASAIGQTDLQAATNKFRKLVKQAPTVAANVGTWVADFLSAEANFAWAEFGLFNGATGGVMLNRAVSANGTKAAGSVWTFTVTIQIS